MKTRFFRWPLPARWDFLWGLRNKQEECFSDVIVRNYQRIMDMVGSIVGWTEFCKWLNFEKPREEPLLLQDKWECKIWMEEDSGTEKTRIYALIARLINDWEYPGPLLKIPEGENLKHSKERNNPADWMAKRDLRSTFALDWDGIFMWIADLGRLDPMSCT